MESRYQTQQEKTYVEILKICLVMRSHLLLLQSNKLLLYPTSMSKEKIFQELYKSREEKNGIANAANIIRKEIKDLRDELPWLPQPADLEPDKFIIPSNLEAFLLYLFGIFIYLISISEMLTENAYKVAEQQTDADVILPEATAKEQFDIYVADNIDRAEETLTGMTIYFHSDILCFIDCLEFC